MGVRKHKETNWDKITPKAKNNYSQEPKREKIVWGMGENAAAWVYIASVGSPSGWCINVVRTRAALGTSRQVARPDGFTNRLPCGCRTRPDDWAPFPFGLQESTVWTTYPSGRSTLKQQKTEENSQKSNFSKSVSEHACKNH